jgi:hypothetical protein
VSCSMENITFTFTFTGVMIKIKQLMSNVCKVAKSNIQFALMVYKWLDFSIVGFLLTNYHSLNDKFVIREKHFT